MSKPNWRQQLAEKEARDKEREEQMKREKEAKMKAFASDTPPAANSAPALAVSPTAPSGGPSGVVEESQAHLGVVSEDDRASQEAARLTRRTTAAQAPKKEQTAEEIMEIERKRTEKQEDDRRAEEIRLKMEAKMKAWEAKNGKAFGGEQTVVHTHIVEEEEVELGMPSQDPEVIKKKAAAARLERLMFPK